MNEIEIYKSSDDIVEINVILDKETVWLSQQQITELFQRDRTVITKHINNVFKEGELDEKLVSANFAHTTQHGAIPGKTQESMVKYYNLDVIISVGYRVKSQRGTQFRQWATQRLKDYLVKGYTINQKRLLETENRFNELKNAIGLIANISENKSLSDNETSGLLKVLNDYAKALDVLDQYDHQTLHIPPTTSKEIFRISYDEAINAINELKKKFGGSELFGKEKDASFKSSLNTIYQTFDGKELYPGFEVKAAHLLYFVVKNHSFTDGNKRIAALLFVWFLNANQGLFENRMIVIDNNALVAITLMVASSKPDDKEMMIKVIVNLINNRI
ncbi:MAG: cytochrome C biogenesis protein CycH [Bacteroidetes bacterium GWA2_32_17]|nr:MAG: cytochrome C biogenesis protein CycH [Bacteroidetes bacterium GWA2_32_17]